MRKTIVLAVLSCLVLCGEVKAAQDQEHYRRAMADNSTSPYFVLVTIKDDITDHSVTGCVAANFLKGAIYREFGGEWDPTNDDEKRKARRALMQKTDQIALNSTDHIFHFSKPEALANVPLRYTEDELVEARKAVQSLGLKALERPPDFGYQGSLKKLQWSAALACAIIEQGASARQSDITSQIYAEP